MSTPAFEESPFDEEYLASDADRSPVPRRKPTDPFNPFSKEDLDRLAKQPPHMRLVDPWKCAYNLTAADGSIRGGMGGSFRQCAQRLADPTKSRYCYEHALSLGVAFYSPEEAAAVVTAETTHNLTRLVPKAVRTLETVMDDEDAPQGVRAKAAESVLDRTGYGKGIDLHIDATVEVKDPMAVLRERLTVLHDAQMEAASHILGDDDVVDGEVVEENTPPPEPSAPALGPNSPSEDP